MRFLVGGGGLLHDLWPPGAGEIVDLGALGAELLLRHSVARGGDREERDGLRRGSRAAPLPGGARSRPRPRARLTGDHASRRSFRGVLDELASEMPRPEVTADPSGGSSARGGRRSTSLDRGGVPAGPWLGVAARNWTVGVDQESWECELVAGVRELRLPAQPRRSLSSVPAGEDPAPGRCRSVETLRGRGSTELKTHVLENPCSPEELGGAIGGCDVSSVCVSIRSFSPA